MKSKERVRYYNSFNDDFSQTKDQNYTIPDNYCWIRRDWISKVLSGIIYSAAIAFSSVYCRLFLHMKFIGREKIKTVGKKGFFIFANHTQPFGDVFTPALAALPKRIYTIVSPANFAIPVIGKILPYLGALPTTGTLSGLRKLHEAINERLKQGRCITIYPEAHVWEYCSFIRTFADTSFRFPVKNDAPSFCMTTTYQKRKFGVKPAATVYIDGPFYYDKSLDSRMAVTDLHNRIYTCMCQRSANSNYNYINYIKSDIQ